MHQQESYPRWCDEHVSTVHKVDMLIMTLSISSQLVIDQVDGWGEDAGPGLQLRRQRVAPRQDAPHNKLGGGIVLPEVTNHPCHPAKDSKESGLCAQ